MDIYEYRESQVQAEVNNPIRVDVVEKIVYEGGIRVYMQGIEYAHKSYPTPQALEAVNAVKRITTEFLKIGRATSTQLLVSYDRMTWEIIKTFILKREFQTPTAKVVGDFVRNFLAILGFDFNLCDRIGSTVSHTFEYDAPYRFRLQDIVNETSVSALFRNPYKEVIRLLNIAIDREAVLTEYIRPKLRKLKWLALVLLVPKYKKAFRKAVEWLDIESMKSDTNDEYWMKQRKDYYYFGEKPNGK